MRIGIISFAHPHAEVYIELLSEWQEIELIGISDDHEARGKTFANRYEVPYFHDYGDLLSEQVEGVILCSETSKHRTQVEKIARAGVHVLCEKPISTNLEDARVMLDVCDQANVILMIAYPMRFSVPFYEVKTDFEKGKLGRVFAFKTTNQAQIPVHLRDWFTDEKLSGGGAVMDHTVHLADIMRWFLSSEVSEVYAQHNRILYAEQVGVETAGLIMLTFESGVFASLDCSWSKPLNYPTWGEVTMDVVAELGVVHVNAYKQRLDMYQPEDSTFRWEYWGSSTKKPMLEEFFRAIKENRSPTVSGIDGYKSLEIALAAYKSASMGKSVKLPLVRD